MLVSAFHFAALSRADLEVKERVWFYLYADEFQSFLTPSFGLMLAEDRKYGLHLIHDFFIEATNRPEWPEESFPFYVVRKTVGSSH
jgi:hypothetical protein